MAKQMESSSSVSVKYRTEIYKLLDHFGLSGHAAEIGVAEGCNAEVMASWPQITKLYLIDGWTRLNQAGDGSHPQAWHDNNLKEVRERMKPYPKAVIMQGLSADMIAQIPDDSLIYAYIDCDHSYEGCLADLVAIWPKLKDGAILAGHDVSNPAYGVGEAVRFFCGPPEKKLDINIIEEDHWSMASFWFRK